MDIKGNKDQIEIRIEETVSVDTKCYDQASKALFSIVFGHFMCGLFCYQLKPPKACL